MPVDDSLFKRLPIRRAFQEIVEQISNLIYTKKLIPGDKLPSERELAIHFGAGRMAVREAFRVLEQTGLIYIKQGVQGGAFVKEVDVTVVSDSICNLIRRASISLEDFIAVRTGIERLIVEALIGNVTDELLDKLEKNIDETKAVLLASDDEKIPSFVPEAAHFHLELASGTNNPLYEILEESLLKVMRAFMREGSYDFEFNERHLSIHHSLCGALKDKNLSRAMECLDEHAADMFDYFENSKK